MNELLRHNKSAQMIEEDQAQQYFGALVQRFGQFLHNFKVDRQHPYVRKALQSQDVHERAVFEVNLKDIVNHDDQLAEKLILHFQKLEPELHKACHTFVKVVNKAEPELPVKLELFNNSFQNLRILRCQLLGKLITFRGIVTLATEVHPEVRKGVFKCNYCGELSRPIVQQFRYSTPRRCVRQSCDNKDSWKLIDNLSEFNDLQRIKVQQDPNEIPPGGMPRSIEIILRDSLVERAKPGDSVIVTGYLCAAPQVYCMRLPGEKAQAVKEQIGKRSEVYSGGVSGLRGLGIRDLSYKLIFVASSIYPRNSVMQSVEAMEDDNPDLKYSFDQAKYMKKALERFSPADREIIRQIAEDPDRYRKLANSLFPDIFGHHEIKKAIILQLFSGVHKDTDQKLRLRGDLNILVVGDPSTAKSQFLKITAEFMPRSIYSNGKTSSSAGLTASVTKDINGDYAIQAGALVLADNGVCCIDQFDKMSPNDMTSIHEAMEQQTISLAKAGVNATLNTRTSILAAANPRFGRYDKAKSLRANLSITDPIMSRFDLFFVVTDHCREEDDRVMAEYILGKHCGVDHSAGLYSKPMVQRYLRYAKGLEPRFLKESAVLIREKYLQLRSEHRPKDASYMVTVRQLESLIRLSEAIAKLNNDVWVRKDYVQEASRLLNESIVRIERDDVPLDQFRGDYQALPVNPPLVEDPPRRIEHISYEEYRGIQNFIVRFIRSREELVQEEQRFALPQEDIVNQYMHSLKEELSLEELDRKRVITTAVINRMIKKEKILRVVDYSQVPGLRMLGLHPDFIEEK